MAAKTTKIKNRFIELTGNVYRSWGDAEVILRSSGDTIVIKKVQKAPFWDTLKKLKTLRKKVSKKDIESAVKWARR